MGVLPRAIFREIASSALLGTILFTFVLFLQNLGRSKQLFEILVRGSAPGSTVAYMFALVLLPTMIFALPVGTLVGVLIGLGRMSADGEVTAMRAAGVPSRKVVFPVIALALFTTALCAASSLWLTPLAIRETYRVLNTVIASQLTAEIQPRVFEEQFTNTDTILYVGDVLPTSGSIARWRDVFIADLTPGAQRSTAGREFGDAPRITVAAEALAVPDPARNSIQLAMSNVSTYDVGKDPAKEYSTSTPHGTQRLAARPRSEATAKPYVSMETRELAREAKDSVEADIQLQQRFALPPACFLLAMVGIPLGVSSRKSGKSAAFALTVSLAFLYYMGLISLLSMAEQGQIPVWAAAWTMNAVFGVAAIGLMVGLERAGDRDLLSRIRAAASNAWFWLRSRLTARIPGKPGLPAFPRIPLLPGLVDTYVLSSFLFYFAILLASFVLLAHVFIFFDLLGDIVHRSIPMKRVMEYHLFLTPKLIYDSAPMSVLVGVLVTFGLLSKSNEVTAMKACGVSVFRLAAPVIAASLLLSGGLFAFDHYYIPEANRIQDGILNEIKGRPIQTYLRADRTWIKGEGSRIYYYKHLDSTQKVMVGVHVYELNPQTFHLERHIYAQTARWEPSLRSWIFQNGWSRDFEDRRGKTFAQFRATTFPELDEAPAYFLREVKQEKQLNFLDLDQYIRGLQESGFDTVRLQVQFHKKFSTPLFALFMALLSVPFAFVAGNRGAMAGVGVSFGIAISYWAILRLFEEIGNINQLPPPVAAWAPDAVFALAGLYLFSRMRT